MSTDHLVARFYDHPRLNIEESKTAGHKVYDTVTMVELRNKGERGESVSRLVKDADKDETEYYKTAFPGAWAQYKGGGDGGFVSGTLLKALDLQIGEIQMLEQMGIRTVEELASMNDSGAMKVRGGLSLKNKAVVFMKAQQMSRDGNLMESISRMEARIAELETENAELKPKRGRPRKEPVDDGQSDAERAM